MRTKLKWLSVISATVSMTLLCGGPVKASDASGNPTPKALLKNNPILGLWDGSGDFPVHEKWAELWSCEHTAPAVCNESSPDRELYVVYYAKSVKANKWLVLFVGKALTAEYDYAYVMGLGTDPSDAGNYHAEVITSGGGSKFSDCFGSVCAMESDKKAVSAVGTTKNVKGRFYLEGTSAPLYDVVYKGTAGKVLIKKLIDMPTQ